MTVVVGIILPGHSIVVGARVDPVFRFKIVFVQFSGCSLFNVCFGYLSFGYTSPFQLCAFEICQSVASIVTWHRETVLKRKVTVSLLRFHTRVGGTMFVRNGAVTPRLSRECDIACFVNQRRRDDNKDKLWFFERGGKGGGEENRPKRCFSWETPRQ